MLKPHLANSGMYLHPPVLIANARKKGKVHRGGGRRYLPMKKDILRFLAQEKGQDVFFTTMIDLYAIHPEFPGLAEAEKLRHMPDKRVEALERTFAQDIGDDRFVPYIQLHEYEAYLFSDPTWFGYFYSPCERQIAALKAIVDRHDTPELIDDGLHSAPSKRIIVQFPDYEDAKAAVGPQVATPGPRQSPEVLPVPAPWKASCFLVGVELASTRTEASSIPTPEPTLTGPWWRR